MSIFYNYVKNSVRKASKNLVRDYSELELLQSGKSSASDRFVAQSFIRTKDLLFRELSDLNFRSISFQNDKLPMEDGLHILVRELEGSQNLKKALPFFGMTIVQQKIENGHSTILASIISLPALGVVHYAEDGQGAWREGDEEKATSAGRRLRSTGQEDLFQAICNKDFASIDKTIIDKRFGDFRNFRSIAYDIACFAEGKLDGVLVKKNEVILSYALEIFAKETGAFFRTIKSGHSIASGSSLAHNFK